MIKNILIILILVFGFSFSEVSHSRLTGTNIHTVYRWQFADSAARVNQSVSAADTMKLAYQRSDSTSWVLVSTTGARWKKIAYASNQNTLTTSTMTLDSLKLTKGINATGGTFSGRVTGTDFEVSDSIKGVTGTFSGRVTATDFQASDSIKGVTGAFSGTLTVDSVRTRVSVFDSVKLGTGSYLKTYAEGSFPCTLKTSDVTVQQIGTAYYTKIGNVLTIFIREIFGLSNSVDLKLYCSLPFVPKNNLAAGVVRGYDAGTPISLTYEWSSGSPTYIEFKRYDNVVFTTSGLKGISSSPIIYITQ